MEIQAKWRSTKGGGLALGRSENPRVSGSIPFLGIFYFNRSAKSEK
jgi:hypothetical protein